MNRIEQAIEMLQDDFRASELAALLDSLDYCKAILLRISDSRLFDGLDMETRIAIKAQLARMEAKDEL